MLDARLGTMLTFISGPPVALAEPGKVIELDTTLADARGANELPLVCVAGSEEPKPARPTGRPLWGAEDLPVTVRRDDASSEDGRIDVPSALEVDLLDGKCCDRLNPRSPTEVSTLGLCVAMEAGLTLDGVAARGEGEEEEEELWALGGDGEVEAGG